VKGLDYYWQRRKVVKRAIRNLGGWATKEPFRPKGKRGEKVIIFVCQNVRARTFNIAFPLRTREKVRTILLSTVFEYDFQKKAFDEIHVFFNYDQLLKKVAKLADKYEVLAVIGATEPIKQSRVLLDMERRWPVLIDQFDSFWSSTHFAGIDPNKDEEYRHVLPEIEEEKYCFQKADGIIARSGELPLLFKELGLSIPTLLYEDGCNDIYFQPLKPSSRQGEWSAVYPGIFYPMHLDPKIYGSAQLVPMGPLFAAEKIHFHLYPSPIHDYQYPEYEAEAARNPYFHIHPSVNFDQVQKEISQYDFGWYANNFLAYGFTSETYRRFAVSTKFCTYLEAGLPVISNRQHLRGVETIEKTGCGILVEDDAPVGLAKLLEGRNIEELRQGVARAREEMNVNQRGGELLRFIESVSRIKVGGVT